MLSNYLSIIRLFYVPYGNDVEYIHVLTLAAVMNVTTDEV